MIQQKASPQWPFITNLGSLSQVEWEKLGAGRSNKTLELSAPSLI
jgi:hypothetical protein